MTETKVERYYETTVVVERFNAQTYRWEPMELHRDAAIRELSADHQSFPGMYLQLRMPRAVDPTTGTTEDEDGDRSIEMRYMAGATVWLESESLYAHGFVQNEPKRMPPPDAWHREKWTQYVWSKETEEWAETVERELG